MTEPEQLFRYVVHERVGDFLLVGWMVCADLGTYHTDVWGAVLYWRPCSCRYTEPLPGRARLGMARRGYAEQG